MVKSMKIEGGATPSSTENSRLMAQNLTSGLKPAFARLCKNLVENPTFNTFTTALTLYALFGDDCRLWLTAKGADVVFDVFTVIALVVFSIECVAASIGKEDYFLSFFFYLDLIATLSLILDITTVAESLSGKDGSSAASYTRTGTQAARLLRILRLIRLFRIVKLYKTYMDQQQRKKMKAALERRRAKEAEDGYSSRVSPGEDDDALIDFDDDELNNIGEGDEMKTESRVGKKLSDMTTRRVIVLILSMLLFVPQFQLSENFIQYQTAPQIGQDLMQVFLQEIEDAERSKGKYASPAAPATSQLKSALNLEYEKELLRALKFQFGRSYHLRYIYFHNPHQDQSAECNASVCPNVYLGRLVYLGKDRDSKLQYPEDSYERNPYIRELAAASAEWESWYNVFDSEELIGFDGSPLPYLVKQRLIQPWTTPCKDLGLDLIGIALQSDLPCPSTQLRFQEISRSISFVGQEVDSGALSKVLIAQYDLRYLTAMEAVMSIINTIFVCIVLAITSSLFGKDSKELVLIPIERMIGKMHRIRDNPLVAMKLGDEEFRKQEIERKREKELASADATRWTKIKTAIKGLIWPNAKEGGKKKRKIQEPMETVILESTLIKLGGLLAVGFGVAGAEIIGQNMSGTDSSGVNAMVSGSKVEAIFGFCNIANFSIATEILSDRVMVFVNQIAEIVHSLVDMFGGNANKNIGDAFLLVWKISTLPSDISEEDLVALQQASLADGGDKTGKIDAEHLARRMRMSDMSIVAFSFTIAAINKSAILSEYREHPGFLARIPNFRVTMGFGLHLGYAIEGAIGSEFKIDASYLSPNVNTASRLEAATKQFGVSLLMSHFLMDQCSPKLRYCCRQIDRVMVKGSKKPVGLYTCDLATGVLRVLDLMRGIDHKTFTVRRKYEVRQIRELKKLKKWSDEYEAHQELLGDPEIQAMREPYTREFFQRFAMAFRNYIAGEWTVAREMLEITQNMLISRNSGSKFAHILVDSPSQTLLAFMRDYGYEAPANWDGVRALTNK